MVEELSVGLSINTLSDWKKKRRNTMIGYIIIGSIVGIDYSVILSTVYIYLRDVIHTPHPNFCYGLIITLFNLSSTLFGAISGRWVDKTRQIKMYINTILILQVIGNLIYAIPYSVAFPIIGRTLAGISDPFSNVCTGEVLRIYHGEESTRALWWLASTYSIGFVAGPGIAIFFKGVSFIVAGIQIDHLNFVGIFIASLGVFALVVCNTMLHDCSAEFDLKDFMKDNERGFPGKTKDTEDHNDEMENINEENGQLVASREKEIVLRDLYKERGATMSLNNVLKGLMSSQEALLIFISTFILVFSLFGTDVLIPLLIENTFHWPMDVTSYVFISYGIGYFVILVTMSTFFTSKKCVYVSTIICFTCILLQYVILGSLVLLPRDEKRDVILFVFFLCCWLIGWCLDAVLLRTLIANMVPSNIQSFTETLRSGVARISTILASLIFPLVTNYLHWTSLLMFSVLFFLLLGFLMKMKQFIHPREINFNAKEEQYDND